MRREKGITLIGFLLMAALVCSLGLVTIKVVPVYINHYSVVRSIQALQTLPQEELKQVPPVVVAYLKERLFRQLYLNEIRFLTKKDIKIDRTRSGYKVTVPYEITTNLISNVFLLFKFKPSYEVVVERH